MLNGELSILDEDFDEEDDLRELVAVAKEVRVFFFVTLFITTQFAVKIYS